MTEFACQGCGTPLVKAWKGRNPKWCSDRCRKNTTYGGVCIECGGPHGDGSASGRCADCRQQRLIEANAERYSQAHRRVEEMWAAGATYREIGAAMGWAPQSVSPALARLRRYGVNLPYRRPASIAEAARASGKRVAEKRWAA